MEAVFAQVGLGGDIQSLFATEFFIYLLPWLFVFALMYGILSHFQGGIPKSNSARAVISLVSAFAVLPAAPFIGRILTQLNMGFIIVVSGLLVFIILVELMGVKSGKDVIYVDPKTGQQEVRSQRTNIFEAHGKTFAILVIIIAGLLFAGSGGFEILGLRGFSIGIGNYPLFFFLAVIALIIWWLTSSGK